MTRQYLFTDTKARRNVSAYGRDEALDVFGQDVLYQLDTGAVVTLKSGATVVDLVAHFDRTVA